MDPTTGIDSPGVERSSEKISNLALVLHGGEGGEEWRGGWGRERVGGREGGREGGDPGGRGGSGREGGREGGICVTVSSTIIP